MGMKLDFSKERTPAALKMRLSQIAKSHSLRRDAKQAESRFSEFDRFIASIDHFYLGDFLPAPFIKGSQPKYLETIETEGGVPVISTLAIQNLSIVIEACRFVAAEDFEALDEEKKPHQNDVLLTLDGGTSIGKPVLFDLEDDYAVDSHVAILRPSGLDPKLLVYLLASPIGQLQFNRAESGASGQTGVTEEDVRRFRFPSIKGNVSRIVAGLDGARQRMAEMREKMAAEEKEAWADFNSTITSQNGKGPE